MKMPPKAKIYEAFSAIADERIKINKNSAIVKSSDYKKEYQIFWNDFEISSNDNATFWQGYPGYPVIAVWLELSLIPYDKKIIKYFKNINWHEINEKNKRNYDKGINDLLTKFMESGVNIQEIKQEVDNIYLKIETLQYKIIRKLSTQK